MRDWQTVCVSPGEFLLPKSDADMSAWAVVACDQFTAQPEYWEKQETLRAGQPSALDLVLPEAYLSEADARVPKILASMRNYLENGVLAPAVGGMVLTARTTQSGTRLGLLLCADLEEYDFTSGSKSLIRATEGTILSRIPPRLRVREQAPLELSHVLLLCDDPGATVIEPLYAARDGLRPLYDIALAQGGGRLQGWAVEDEKLLCGVYDALFALREALPDGGILLAVGDGNHSLATAKAHWENVKKELPPWEEHPARYAMCELCNLHDKALVFEPIHRAVFGASGDDVLRALLCAGAKKAQGAVADVTICTRDGQIALTLDKPEGALAVGALQDILDEFMITRPGVSVDYIHGMDALEEVVEKQSAVGLALPAMDKALLFPAVTARGALPRKTFSMGEAREKRYYVEARVIEHAEK